ncbi:hypothetical protein Cs7R123_11600 [Catellatospora sp. TT07R-123]|uniref:hypothetical protein n=1 Tax=Catellatospora sp. TT07R-123 TaxID=2733863 RepID=UPI001B2E9656|nr:hypothetical protein [Catellatospora sp. TT07R-123]GHJ43818.1 hypothetical protein Cs7R123_11600 [Catellatospora sp. TT07R-123]
MRLRIALASTVAVLASILVAPAAAHAAPDSIACSAAGSYSKVIGGTPTTFWLVGTVGSYRYWHVVLPSGGELYQRSYVVRCSGDTIAWSADLTPTSGDADHCGTTSTTLSQYVGSHTGLVPFLSWYLEYDYHYWHVKRWVFTGTFAVLVYDHSEVAACLT